ncbi:hypothetical protein MARBORIA2_14590 [Methanobrevibacter arboriphilus]|jgi:adenosyl cobinamide kinase/adenosyl cobinamide phosphate guanylyltransferase|uniref:AAA family ATPase n=1 Tax=Methanobrevibacter arboriphilus TaxID=39441 RepID=UPI0022EDD50C|nr:AAA family ATPase [Methanobrevibacter arboriphilus]GLI12369.1 hypothetical protein MARBORIA2_14590 [Methanobrevibacter arboriphilus]
MLKLKKRGDDLKKVLVYGLDGSGKSTFAETYCKDNKLNPVVIDVDDTNYTDLDLMDLDLSSDIIAYNNMKKVILEIKNSDYDTIVLDGVSSLIELLTPSSDKKDLGMRAYKIRADRFSSVLQKLLKTGKNLIFIGQIDMEVIYNDENQSNKPVLKINSIVNEKYKCFCEKGSFKTETMKFRGVKNGRFQES